MTPTRRIVTAGIDVGSGAVKCVVMAHDPEPRILSSSVARLRRRQVGALVDELFGRTVHEAAVGTVDYVATTGEGEDIPFATGHFYGMTTHARGALSLRPAAKAVLDVGALHARAVRMDGRGKVLDYKMTSQCASGSGQFLENIARYLGVPLQDVGRLSLEAAAPETVSSICAVLAETDVINMVSRGISTQDILRGIHESMAGRFARLLRAVRAEGTVFVSGGLSGDIGLSKALEDALDKGRGKRGFAEIELATHPEAIQAGALGAAIWGAFRHRRLGLDLPAWTRASSV